MGKLKLWTCQEDTILCSVSTSLNSKKWKTASQELKRHGFERTDIECRERYVNHLDPTVNKETWNQQELQILYSKFAEYGNKWFLIQRYLPGRTQTKIKNYFYGSIRHLLKMILKVAFGNNRTGFVNDIKTDELLNIYEGKGRYEGQVIVQNTIKMLGYRVNRHGSQKMLKKNLQLYSNFGKRCLLMQQEKNSQEVKIEEEDNSSIKGYRGQEQPKEKRLEYSKVEVVSKVCGEVISRERQLAYLQKMANLHYQRYLHFQSIMDGMEQGHHINIK